MTRQTRWLYLLCAVAMVGLMSACEDQSESPKYFFPTWPQSAEEEGPPGDLRGQLVARDGCLFWDAGEQGKYLVLWPSTFTLSGTDPPVVTSETGQELHVGELATLGGGERSWRSAQEMIGVAIPDRCRTSGYWLTTEVILEG